MTAELTRRMPAAQAICASTVLLMNMSQLVIGAALGYIVAQGALHGIKRFVGWLQRDEVRQRIRTLTPWRGSTIIGGFIRHAGLIAAGAAVITLGVWATRDYLAVRSARSAAIADTFDPATAAPVTDAPAPADEGPAPARARKPEPARAVPVNNVDPYTDSDFQVHRSQRAGKATSLKETLLRRSEEKARTDLLKETQQRVHRSQYDCEAADRASKYVKGGLDVWGFALWQVKYFPASNYTGATLPQCKDIKNVVDPSWVDLKSTVAQANHS
jgi:hypothetical protein